MIPTKKMPGGGWGAVTGRDTIDFFKNTTLWCTRQLVKFALPWIASLVSAFCPPSGRAGRLLDRLIIMAEGGQL